MSEKGESAAEEASVSSGTLVDPMRARNSALRGRPILLAAVTGRDEKEEEEEEEKEEDE